MLSVITMFHDGTEELMEKWIQNVNDNVKINHEIVIVDNTTKQNLPEVDGVKIVRMGHNAYQFAGRRAGVENATGDYCFLVDSDDEILPINNFEWDEDLICFNYMAKVENDKSDYMCKDPYTISYTASKGDFFNVLWKRSIKNMVWNKFYRTEMLKKLFAKLPYFESAYMDDVLLNIFVLAEVQTIGFETKCFYKYFFGTGISTKEKYTSIEPLKILFNGMNTSLTVFNLAFSKEVQQQSGITLESLLRSSVLYCLKKYESLDESIMKEYTEMLGEMFEKDILLKAVKNSDGEIERKAMLKAKHCINDFIE